MPKRKRTGGPKKGARPLILVSNDDGVHAAGLKKLVGALRSLGRVVVVAPDQERSAASHSITLHRPLRVERVRRDVYSVDGTPTDCIMLAIHEILDRRPDLVVSGINHGANLGDDIHYSGTVSAAYEGGIMGIPSMAVSLAGRGRPGLSKAGDVAALIARRVLKEGLPRGVILNVNVPSIPDRGVKGTAFTKQGKRNYGGVIVVKEDPRGRKYYWIGGDEQGFEDIPGSDCNAVIDGFVSVTPLRVNLTDGATLKKLTGWKLRG
jgi:5'-nucleotidase